MGVPLIKLVLHRLTTTPENLADLRSFVYQLCLVVAAANCAVLLGVVMSAVLRGKRRCPVRPCWKLRIRTICCCCCFLSLHVLLASLMFYPKFAKARRSARRKAEEAAAVAEFMQVKENLSSLSCTTNCPVGYQLKLNLGCAWVGHETFSVSSQPAVAASETRPGSASTIVLILPYRNREPQLHNFSRWLAGRYLPSRAQQEATAQRWEVYVVEQDDDTEFNKGFLINAGLRVVQDREPQIFADDAWDLAHNRPPRTCIIQHDVDFLPVGSVDYSVCGWPRQLSSEIGCSHSVYHSPVANTVPYPTNFGGVVSMRPAHWIAVNGFSNMYPGWGGEDDDLFHRVRQSGLLGGSLRSSSFCQRNPEWNGSGWVDSEGLMVAVSRPPLGHGLFACQPHERGATQSEILTAAEENQEELEEVSDEDAAERLGREDEDDNSNFEIQRILANSKFMNWMQGCKSIADNCSTYWRGRDGVISVQYRLVSMETSHPDSAFAMHRTKVISDWTPDAWEKERRLRSRFGTFFVKHPDGVDNEVAEMHNAVSMRDKVAMEMKLDKEMHATDHQGRGPAANSYPPVGTVLFVVVLLVALVGALLMITAPKKRVSKGKSRKRRTHNNNKV